MTQVPRERELYKRLGPALGGLGCDGLILHMFRVLVRFFTASKSTLPSDLGTKRWGIQNYHELAEQGL